MSARIVPLRLDGFEQLPKHARRCVFWEVDPATVGDSQHLSDPEFEKEAWLSMVMLEWGSCGQVAVTGPPSRQSTVGYALYAPPGVVPRAQLFPTAPVSADAVLLTSLGVEPGHESDGLPHSIIANVVAELVRRGVRALEAFGRTNEALELCEGPGSDPLRPRGSTTARFADAADVLGECTIEQCMIDVDFLKDVGFTVVAPHQHFPRLRLELDRGLGWKADVEAALERLLESVQIPQPAGAGPVVGAVF
ncbi:acetyltransferase [Mycobacterium sp. D16R24]|uniref:acetyltransferase n=1 Tax=Mycobacterium sp. D16R24 TaxID=1855656 RepID=UPI000993A926|nr:acetyltransferase [Mycobacterium sp. D16R24]